MCIWSIELIWIATNGKMEEKHTFWANFGDLYRYTFGPVPILPSRTEPVPVQVRAVPVQVRAVPVQVVLCFSVSTSVCILAIICSFLIRFV